jgi:long-chain acyl-CoA synthetase
MPQALRLASAGKAIPGTELRIDTSAAGVDTESEAGPQASAEQQGEVLARGSGVFAGYRNQPDQTEKSFSDDWFRTGDLGFIDNDGFLYIRGRASTLIVTEGGKNIQPEPVEEAYQGHFYIKEIGVLQHDSQLVALVVPEMDEVNKRANGDTERAIREAINEQSNLLPAYQRVSDYAITPETLAKTNLGKLKRHVLAERYDLAKQGIVETGEDVGPLPLEDMSEQDRTLLENSAAREVWDWLADRYPDRRLSPDTSPQLDLGIDSLSWLNLTLDIRERTGVELSDEAIKRINTVRDLLNEVASEAQTSEGGATSMSAVENPDEVLSDEQKEWLQPPGPVLHVLGIVVFVLLRAVARLFFRLEVRGAENVPDSSPFVITPNHTSYLDAPTVASALSYTQMRQIHWAGSVDVMFSHPVMRFISRMSQTMPVAGEGAGTGRSSLAFASIVLKRKRSLVWFPEGRISPNAELLPFRQGIGLVLDQYQVPVVPVYIEGANEALPEGSMLPRFRKVSVTFGKPMKPGELAQQGQGERPAERIAQALHDQVVELKNNSKT